jgi:hypothetical protein
VALPAEFAAVTRSRSVLPTSAVPSVRVVPVAPLMAVHEPPDEVQRSHWRVSVGTGFPVHVPVDPVSTSPAVAVPLTVGGDWLEGAAAGCGTAGVAMLSAVAEPALFVAVTRRRRVLPASAVVIV